MALRLDDLPEQWPVNANLVVAQVRDDEAAAEFCDAMVAGFEMPPFLGPIFLEFTTRYGYDARRPFQNYVARLDGRPVGVMSVFAAAGVAGIYNVAVPPEARRQGVAGGLLQAVLRDLRAAGHRAAILHSAPMGYNLYRRLGFEEYCTIGRYLWQPPAA
jgi:GNAT superfamily N-acetyltransferase